MKFAYADPPYLGCSRRYYSDHPEHAKYDTIEGHAALLVELKTDYPDGWALSMTTGNLKTLMPFIPDNARIAAWVKPFAIFTPNVNPAYTWEPVIFCGGRRGDRTRKTVKDHLACNITLKKGLTGAKPKEFCDWVLDLLGYEEGDTLVDLFPGTEIMTMTLSDRATTSFFLKESKKADKQSRQMEAMWKEIDAP